MSILPSYCIIALCLLSSFTLAQTPSLTVNSAYATVNEKILYIQGGTDLQQNLSATVSQFYSLDLTQNGWNSLNPPWKALNSVQAPVDYQHSMTVSQDQKSLFVWGSLTGFSTYNIAEDSWTTVPKPVGYATNINGLHASTDPATGIIYVPAGATNGSVMAYNPLTHTTRYYNPPVQFTSNVSHYGSTWCDPLSSVLMYGGFYQRTPNITVPGLYQFHTKTFDWTLVVAYNGTKIILFGGQLTDRTPLGGIYILDISTWVWKRGAAADPSLNRNGMACGVSGDYFVAWGGGRLRNFSASLVPPTIYNMKTDQWTTQFGSSTDPNNPNPNPNPNPGPSIPVIIGSTVGGIVILALLAYLVIRRYKAKNKGSKAYTSINSDKGSENTRKSFTSDIDLQNISLSQDHHATNTPTHYPPPAASHIPAPLFSQSASYSRVDQYPEPLYPINNAPFGANPYTTSQEPVSINAFNIDHRPVSTNSSAGSQGFVSTNVFTNPYVPPGANSFAPIPTVQAHIPTVQAIKSPTIPGNKPRPNNPQVIVWNQQMPGETTVVRGPHTLQHDDIQQ
ncbi:hypothetical protein BGZ76_011672 [Entomortierella beljakovae]|nr:hypothetical protein BGZ76_011672 [Entomortierella beljakovae]